MPDRQASRPQTADPAPALPVTLQVDAADAPHLDPAQPTTDKDPWTAAEAIAQQLARLDDFRHGQTMKATILALVSANLARKPEETIWDLPETCNRSTYQQKWKRNPVFADVLAKVKVAAKSHQDTAGGRAVVRASRRIQLASEKAAERLEQLIDSPDEATARLAAQAILDRAGLETAAKGTQMQIGSTLEEWRADAEKRRQAVAQMEAEMQDEDTDEEPDPGEP